MTGKKRLSLALGVAGLFAAASPATLGDLYGVHYDTGDVYEISTTDASLTYVGNMPYAFPYGVAGLEYSPNDSGLIYGITTGSYNDPYGVPDAVLCTFDPDTAAVTEVGPLGLSFVFEGGLAFSPEGVAYGVNATGINTPQLFTIDLNTGLATIVGTMSGGQRDVNGLTWRSDGMLVGVERVSGALVTIDPMTAVVAQIATLDGVDVGASGGMAAIGGAGYLATGGPYSTIPGSNSLYSVDLFTGECTLIAPFDPAVMTGLGIGGLAVPEPGSLVLLGLALAVVSRRWR
jgi:hypothetical protein